MKRQPAAPALMLVLILAVGLAASCIGKTVKIDYTGERDNIASIEVIDITKVSDTQDDIEYEVIRTVPREEWDALLGDAMKLEYSSFVIGEPYFMRTGEAVRITFIEPVDGVLFFLYTQTTYCKAVSENGRVRINPYTPHCDEEQWAGFIAKYDGRE